MRCVADASVVVAYLLGEATDAERGGLLDDAHGPTLIDIEVTQTLRGLLRGGKLDLVTADLGREELGQLRLRRHPDAPLLHRAWELRDVCTTYDALYVALAEALDARLLTRDARLGRAVTKLIEVVVSG
ncbi:MAG: type II toxin-antitoxin system VapC family toxin [Solirubrobacterales bacterium]|nr:type II toxin-antitoxin system VapC family toxin [Solirubrobacterales bacterium]